MKLIMENWRDYLLVESLLTEASLDAESNYVYYKTIKTIKGHFSGITSSVAAYMASASAASEASASASAAGEDPETIKSAYNLAKNAAFNQLTSILNPKSYDIEFSPTEKENKNYNPSGILNYVERVTIFIRTGGSKDTDNITFMVPKQKGTWSNEYRSLRLNFILTYPEAPEAPEGEGFANFVGHVSQSNNFVGSMMKQATSLKPDILDTIAHELNHAKQGKSGKDSVNNLAIKQEKIDEYTESVLKEFGRKIKDFFQAGPTSKILEKEWDKEYQKFIDDNGKDLRKLYKSISWTVWAADFTKGKDEKINPTKKIKKVITYILYHALPSEKESFIVGFYRRAKVLYRKKGAYKNKKAQEKALAETFFSLVNELESNLKDSMHKIVDEVIVDSFKDQAKAIINEKIDIAINGMLDISYDRYPIFKKYVDGEL